MADQPLPDRLSPDDLVELANAGMAIAQSKDAYERMRAQAKAAVRQARDAMVGAQAVYGHVRSEVYKRARMRPNDVLNPDGSITRVPETVHAPLRNADKPGEPT